MQAPAITRATPTAERERPFAAFRTDEIRLLVVLRVANFSINLPEATVAMKMSGTSESCQEEAQWLSRTPRPKHDGRKARFYSVVARDNNDQEFALPRQRFLTGQAGSTSRRLPPRKRLYSSCVLPGAQRNGRSHGLGSGSGRETAESAGRWRLPAGRKGSTCIDGPADELCQVVLGSQPFSDGGSRKHWAWS